MALNRREGRSSEPFDMAQDKQRQKGAYDETPGPVTAPPKTRGFDKLNRRALS